MVPITAEQLGSASFRSHHGVRLAYAAGAMVKGIASEAMVLRLARAGLMGFYGAGDLVEWGGYPRVQDWLERGLARPAVQRGLTIPARPA